MAVFFYNEEVKKPRVNYTALKQLIKEEVAICNFKLGQLNYIFCSDEKLLSINVEFLQHDYYTDVITFDYTDNRLLSGDVYISVERVQNNSELFQENFISELVRVIMHGLLHLLGYDDKSSDQVLVMRNKEADLQKRYFEITKG